MLADDKVSTPSIHWSNCTLQIIFIAENTMTRKKHKKQIKENRLVVKKRMYFHFRQKEYCLFTDFIELIWLTNCQHTGLPESYKCKTSNVPPTTERG
jgi:hypothetical protein